MRAPFPYIGGKTKIANRIWESLGDVYTYVEPFAGSAAVLLNRPPDHTNHREIINDIDGLIVNVWRSLAYEPDLTAAHADWPATESDLHARHSFLIGQKPHMTPLLEGDPEWCQPIFAGWWLWGASLWIGGGWCSGNGKWQVIDGRLQPVEGSTGGVTKKRQKVARVGGVIEPGGVKRQRQTFTRQSVFRDLPDDEAAIEADYMWDGVPWGNGAHLKEWFHAIAGRLEKVSIVAGDWTRVLGPVPLHGGVERGIAGVFLDPPYEADQRSRPDTELYGQDDLEVSAAVRAWCVEHGSEPNLRIVLAGMAEEHDELLDHGWTKEFWSATGGYSRNAQQDRRHVEALWMSPHCLDHTQQTLW